jgi:hypothetical protein
LPCPPQKGESESLEKGRVDGPDAVFEKDLLPVSNKQAGGWLVANRSFYLGDRVLDGRAHGVLGDIDMEGPLTSELVLLDTE